MPRLLGLLVDGLSQSLQGLIARLVGDRSQIDAFRQAALMLMSRYHIAAFMTGNGGKAPTDAQLGKLAPHVILQAGYLDGFAAEIQSATEFDAYWKIRAGAYANSIKVPYWQGATRMLPLPAMPAQGTQCLNNCKCLWRVETLDEERGDYDAYWERHAEDSCQTCVEREAQWSPVRIRSGVLMLK